MLEKYRNLVKIYIFALIIFNIVIIINYYRFKENFSNLQGLNTFSHFYYLKNENINKYIQKNKNHTLLDNIDKDKIDIVKLSNKIENYKNIIDNAIKNKYNNIVIIESTFIPNYKNNIINKRIDEFLNRFQNDWDIILFNSNNTKSTIIYNGCNSVRETDIPNAFIINKKFYKAFKNNITNINNIINKSKMYIFDPSL